MVNLQEISFYIIHSSELVAGTSNLLKNAADENVFYKKLELFFVYLQESQMKCSTFKEFLKPTI